MIGAELIAKERQRQIEEEGYDADHDDDHGSGQLAIEAAALAVRGTAAKNMLSKHERWCLSAKDDEKQDDLGRMRQLVVAGALIAAEIDRVQRATLARCPRCDEIATGYTRGTETLDGTEYPGSQAKIEPCGCVDRYTALPHPFVVGYDVGRAALVTSGGA